jgi:MFS family permease
MAVMSLGLTTLFWGFMVDWLGPRTILPMAAVSFGAGCLLFAFSRPQGMRLPSTSIIRWHCHVAIIIIMCTAC